MRPKYKLRTELVDVLNFADFEEFLILKNFITQDDIKVEHVVQQIVDLSLTTQASEEKKDAADVDYLASLSIWELAQISEPSTHLKLAQVVIQLQKQTAIDPKNGGLIETQGSFLWKDLPSFGYTGTEAWREYGGGPFKDPEDPCYGPAGMHWRQKQRWVKLNIFLAQLTQATEIDYHSDAQGKPIIPPYDRSFRGLEIMTRALETKHKHPLEMVANTSLIWAACEWFIHCADKLWDNVLHNLDIQYCAGPRYSRKPWVGFEKERWKFWERGMVEFEQACANADVVEGTRERIHGALADMRRVSGGTLL